MPGAHAIELAQRKHGPRWNVATDWETNRRARRWSEEEIQLVSDWMLMRTPAEIARRLGRSLRAVEQICVKHHLYATRQHYVTSREAARITGLSQQWLTELVRTKRLRAIRIRGGRWWLFNPKTLQRFKQQREEESWQNAEERKEERAVKVAAEEARVAMAVPGNARLDSSR